MHSIHGTKDNEKNQNSRTTDGNERERGIQKTTKDMQSASMCTHIETKTKFKKKKRLNSNWNKYWELNELVYVCWNKWKAMWFDEAILLSRHINVNALAPVFNQPNTLRKCLFIWIRECAYAEESKWSVCISLFFFSFSNQKKTWVSWCFKKSE